jgi:K(+)-stimulated pyrophosphate-energized sodium pump
MISVYIVFGSSILALLVALFFARKVTSIRVGEATPTPSDEKLIIISSAIAEGAMAFLMREYKVIAIFIAVMAVAIVALLDNPKTPEVNEGVFTAIAFVSGAVISCLSGFIGM